jgi:hypothetical protein
MDKRHYRKLKVGNSHYRVYTDNSMRFFGDTDTTKKVIRVNVKKSKATKQRGEVADSVLHELHHAFSPRASEKTVEKRTARSLPRLSKRSKSKLYGLLK